MAEKSIKSAFGGLHCRDTLHELRTKFRDMIDEIRDTGHAKGYILLFFYRVFFRRCRGFSRKIVKPLPIETLRWRNKGRGSLKEENESGSFLG